MFFRIREAREKAGMTQAQLAEILGINNVTLSGYETGKHDPKSDTLVQIALACGVTTDFLLGRDIKTDVSAAAMQMALDYDTLDETGQRLLRACMDLAISRSSK